jgi:predicted flap endonuclease-1-like 5' DNA nuclease
MTDLAQYNLIPIVVAALVGIVVAYWVFRGSRSRAGARPVADPVPRQRVEDDKAVPAAAADDEAEAVAVPSASGPPDALQTMKGVGAKLAAQLNAAGITRFDQLAALTPDQAASLDGRMGPFAGRIAKDRLVEQAAYLARGDTDGFEAAFGRLGGA